MRPVSWGWSEMAATGIGLRLGLNAAATGGAGAAIPSISLSNNSVAETAAVGAAIGSLSVTNGSGSYTFSIAADPDGKFQLDAGDDSQLEVGAGLDFESSTAHLVTIEADNGVDTPLSRQFAISVTNVAEATLEYAMTGALTGEGATIAVACSGATSVRIAYSEDSDIASPAYSAIVATEANSDVAKFALTGLDADTTYYYRCEIDGFLDASIYSFTTQTVGAEHDFSFAFSGDSELNSDAGTVFARIAARDPDIFFGLGDTPYTDIGSNDQAAYRSDWQDFYSNAKTQQLLGSVPYVHIWDDHDFATNNAEASATGAPAAKAVYRQLNPHYPLPDADAIYQSFVLGRVKFIMLDVRSERISGSNQMISATQMAWLKSELDTIGTGTIRAAVISVGVPWISSSDTDTWHGYQAQRTEIADYIIANELDQRVVMIAADMHAVAADDGTNNVFGTGSLGGWPVWHAAPLNRSNSTKGGPYTSGPFASSNGQYAVVDVTDDGSEVTLTFRAYDGTDTLLTTEVFTSAESAYDVPDAFTAGQWSLADAASGGTLTVTVSALPAANGAPITDIEFSVNDGAWTSSGTSTTGTFNIGSLTDDVSANIELRAMNAIGPGADSDVKSATPTAGGGTPFGTIVQSKQFATGAGSHTSITITPDSTPGLGNLLILVGGPDKAAGSAITVPSGFTTEMNVNGAGGSSISGAMAWKIVDGTEASSFTFSWSTGRLASLVLVEVQGPFNASPVDVTDIITDGASAATLALDGGTTTVADEVLVAFFMNDSMLNVASTASVDNGFSILELIDASLASTANGGNDTWEGGEPGMVVAVKVLTATGSSAVTIDTNSSADQRIGGIVGFKSA